MSIENNIEWLTGDEKVCGSFSQKRFVNKMRRLSETRPSEVDIIENQDGSICVHFPLKWVKVTIPRAMSEEQKRANGERLRAMRNREQAYDPAYD